MLANRRSQVLLDRLGRCLKLFVSTESPPCHEFATKNGENQQVKTATTRVYYIHGLNNVVYYALSRSLCVCIVCVKINNECSPVSKLILFYFWMGLDVVRSTGKLFCPTIIRSSTHFLLLGLIDTVRKLWRKITVTSLIIVIFRRFTFVHHENCHLYWSVKS